jgi:hypothetical protein
MTVKPGGHINGRAQRVGVGVGGGGGGAGPGLAAGHLPLNFVT